MQVGTILSIFIEDSVDVVMEKKQCSVLFFSPKIYMVIKVPDIQTPQWLKDIHLATCYLDSLSSQSGKLASSFSGRSKFTD